MENKTKTQSTGQKGFVLEYSVSGMFQSQGFLSRRGIPLLYGKGFDATDIDVLGIYFTAPFKGHKIICDCKNKKNSKPYERIFWSKGLGQFVEASEVYVSLPRASWDIIKFAGNGGVRVITNEILEGYLAKKTSQYGLADEEYYINFFKTLAQVVKSDKLAEESLALIRTLWLRDDPYVAINIALDTLATAWKQYRLCIGTSFDLSVVWKYLIFELVVIIAVQILWICSDTMGLPPKAREEHITTKLTYGDLDPLHVRSMIGTFKDLANEMVRATVPKQYLPQGQIVDFGQITPPSYTNNLLGLIDRAYIHPEWYLNMPQLLDFLLFEQGLKGKEFDDKEYHHMFNNTSLADERLKAARNILYFVKDACGVDWNILLPKSLGNSASNSGSEVKTKQTKYAQDKKQVEHQTLHVDAEKVLEGNIGNDLSGSIKEVQVELPLVNTEMKEEVKELGEAKKVEKVSNVKEDEGEKKSSP
jgi:hypothetical protein